MMIMIDAKSDSDATSIAPSSSPATSPRRNHSNHNLYFVHTPSCDSHYGSDHKSSTATQATTSRTPSNCSDSPMESPSHPSHSNPRPSSASRISGPFRISSLGRKWSRRADRGGWPKFNVIQEEKGTYCDDDDRRDPDHDNKGITTARCRCLLTLSAFGLLFSMVCFIVWGASRPYPVRVSLKDLIVYDLYYGEGSDYSGVPTKMLTVNCSVKINVHNPATFFGIHVSSSTINLMYLKIIVGSGQLNAYYQPRKSQKIVTVNLEGHEVPLYGAGASFVISNKGTVPLRLEFEIRTRGYLVGKLVKTKHRLQIICPLRVHSDNSKITKFEKDPCIHG